MKKLVNTVLILVIVLCLSFQVQAAGIVEQGTCGESAGYTLYDDGLLKINGTGCVAADIFRERPEIIRVEIAEGITEIADLAFCDCKSIKEVNFPDTLLVIGEGAFLGCENLKKVSVPDSVVSYNGNRPFGTPALGAFDGCTNLQSIKLSANAKLLPWGFLGSDRLTKLIIPEGVTQLEAYAIMVCDRLCYVEIPSTVTEIAAWALINNPSLSNIVFKGSSPDMGELLGPCGPKNTVGFYPKGDPSWADTDTLVWKAGLNALIPYTLDSKGNIIPEVPEESVILENYRSLAVEKYPAGTVYPDNYYYIINGNFLGAYGSEAFAFQLSDAMFGYLPISDVRSVSYADLKLGDILYLTGEACVITGIDADSLTVSGVDSNEKVYYDKVLTKAQVEAADGYRTRYGVSPGSGVSDPSRDNKPITLPGGVPTEAEVYERIMALQETHPEGMPYSLKNHYRLGVDCFYELVEEVDGVLTVLPMNLEREGSGCSAFGYMASDTAFGSLPARYILAKDMSYDDIMVGDNLLAYGHEVVVLEVYKDCVVVCEGNYNETMHWGRILTREEVDGFYDILTRYPEGTQAPEREYYNTSGEPDDTPCEHKWSRWNVTNPTSQKEGLRTRECEVCGEKEQEILPKLSGAFQDVPETQYYALPVDWAVQNNITTGVGGDKFAPNNNCTRGQIVTFLWRAAGEPEPTSTANPFKDVKSSDYYYKAVLWAVENGITNGLNAASFGPNEVCTRAQVATFMWRAQDKPEAAGENPFVDVKSSDYYYDAVIWAVENGVTTGTSATTFAPGATCTRGQIVTFMYRAIA